MTNKRIKEHKNQDCLNLLAEKVQKRMIISLFLHKQHGNQIGLMVFNLFKLPNFHWTNFYFEKCSIEAISGDLALLNNKNHILTKQNTIHIFVAN